MTVRLGLDHIGMVAGDLDAAQATFERLGFRLTPRSLHSGALRPGGPVVPWGSGNSCAMFRQGYVELVGITDPALHSSAKTLLAKYEGAHIVAFDVPDAEAAVLALRKRSAGINPVRDFERLVPPADPSNPERTARFRAGSTDKDLFPEARFVFVEHLTRDALWQPVLLDHPNGAIRLEEVTLCVADLDASRTRLTALFGAPPLAEEDGGVTFRLDRGRLRLAPREALKAWAPELDPPLLPYVAGFGVAVADLAAVAALLQSQGIVFSERPGPAILVPPTETHGVLLSFHQAIA